jgi:hypothetical protein
VIPSSSSTKLLRVHYDCTEQTDDAKGDGKAWQSVRAGYGDGVWWANSSACATQAGVLERSDLSKWGS